MASCLVIKAAYVVYTGRSSIQTDDVVFNKTCDTQGFKLLSFIVAAQTNGP